MTCRMVERVLGRLASLRQLRRILPHHSLSSKQINARKQDVPCYQRASLAPTRQGINDDSIK